MVTYGTLPVKHTTSQNLEHREMKEENNHLRKSHYPSPFSRETVRLWLRQYVMVAPNGHLEWDQIGRRHLLAQWPDCRITTLRIDHGLDIAWRTLWMCPRTVSHSRKHRDIGTFYWSDLPFASCCWPRRSSRCSVLKKDGQGLLKCKTHDDSPNITMAAFAFRPIGELTFLGRWYSSGMGTL